MQSRHAWSARLRRSVEAVRVTGVRRPAVAGALALVALAGVGALLVADAGTSAGARGPDGGAAAAVEVAEIERGVIALHRTFGGSLEAQAQFDVAPKVGGRIERLVVDFGDPVKRGQLVAELDNDEILQEVALAEAELAVAKANVAEMASRAALSERTLERTSALHARGVASESQLDASRVEQQAASAALQVAKAQVERAEATRATARIRLGYTKVAATWVEGDDQRVVAERYVDPGDTVSANTALVSVVEIDPITAVVSVTERDYGRIAPGMRAELEVDAYLGRTFHGEVVRIAPVFEETSRQARVELRVPNADRALKPGMFVRATMVLDRAEQAIIVPEAALTRRDGANGVFLVDEAGTRVRWQPVIVSIRDQGRAQIAARGPLDGRVVTLGQHLIDDGSPIVIPEPEASE